MQSLEKLLVNPNVFGIGIEVNYCGTDAANQNTFHNVDRFLRKHGFDLYDLTVRKYSLVALPAPYADKIPAQSTEEDHYKVIFILQRPSSIDSELAINVNEILIMACLFSVFDQKDPVRNYF